MTGLVSQSKHSCPTSRTAIRALQRAVRQFLRQGLVERPIDFDEPTIFPIIVQLEERFRQVPDVLHYPHAGKGMNPGG